MTLKLEYKADELRAIDGKGNDVYFYRKGSMLNTLTAHYQGTLYEYVPNENRWKRTGRGAISTAFDVWIAKMQDEVYQLHHVEGAYKEYDNIQAKEAETVFNGLVNVPDIDIEHKGYHIVPKKDFGGYAFGGVNTIRKGYNIVKDGMNRAPGATWCQSVLEARVMIDVMIECTVGNDIDADKFWKKMRQLQGRTEYKEV